MKTTAVILALALLVFVVLSVVGFALHFLLSPWLLLAVIAVFAWITFRPRRSRQ